MYYSPFSNLPAPLGAVYRTHVVLHIKDPSKPNGIIRSTRWDFLVADSCEHAADLVRNKYLNDNSEKLDLFGMRIFNINHIGDITIK